MKLMINEKLRRQTGETIVETLIALLIAAVALMMLAGMISSTVSMVTTSKAKMEEYYDSNAALEIQAASDSDTSDDTSDDTNGETKAVTIESADRVVTVSTNVDLFKNETFSNNVVYSYSETP